MSGKKITLLGPTGIEGERTPEETTPRRSTHVGMSGSKGGTLVPQCTPTSIIEGLNHSSFLSFRLEFFPNAKPQNILEIFANFVMVFGELEHYELTPQEFTAAKCIVQEAFERLKAFYIQPHLDDLVRKDLQRVFKELLRKLEEIMPEGSDAEIDGDLLAYLAGRTLDDDLSEEQAKGVEIKQRLAGIWSGIRGILGWGE